jgi:hypothetical protein
MRRVHAPSSDVLDAVERDPDPLARRDHRPAEQIIDAQMGQRAAVAPHRRPHATKYKGISHRLRNIARQSRAVEVDAVAAHGNALLVQALDL